MRKLDIPMLEVFVAAVEEKSFSRAGERENVVTSAVSKRITDLEKRFDRVLLNRHGRGVNPTSAGILLYDWAKVILHNLHEAEQAVSRLSCQGKPYITLAANPSAIVQFLPEVMRHWAIDHPDVSIELLERYSVDIPRLVMAGDVDMGFYHADGHASGIEQRFACSDRIVVVVPPGHPLQARSAIMFEEALEYSLLGFFPRHTLKNFLIYTRQNFSRAPKVKLQVSSFEARCLFVREGLGIALLSEGIARRYAGRLGLHIVQLEDAWAERKFYLCARKFSDLDLNAGLFARYFEAVRRLDGSY